MKFIIGFLFVISSIYLESALLAIFSGIFFALLFKLSNDYPTKKLGSKFLQIAVITLGFTLSLGTVYSLTSSYLPFISIFVLFIFFIGVLLGKLLGLDKKLTLLISAGTAICGATAMIAIAPLIKAKPKLLLIAISIVFLLNAFALIIFPIVGNFLLLDQEFFGAWVAMSIHDTSSVIGAAITYGDEAFEVATTLKLGRTLWLIPLVIFISLKYQDSHTSKSKPPFFVIMFVLAIFIGSYINLAEQYTMNLKLLSQSLLIAGLFCIGTQIDLKSLKSIDSRSFTLATLLWVIAIPLSYCLIIYIN